MRGAAQILPSPCKCGGEGDAQILPSPSAVPSGGRGAGGEGGEGDLLNLLIEVTGEKKKDKAAKVATARTLWVPAVNNHGGFGRWDFIEVADPWDAENDIRRVIDQPSELGVQCS